MSSSISKEDYAKLYDQAVGRLDPNTTDPTQQYFKQLGSLVKAFDAEPKSLSYVNGSIKVPRPVCKLCLGGW